MRAPKHDPRWSAHNISCGRGGGGRRLRAEEAAVVDGSDVIRLLKEQASREDAECVWT